MVPPEGSQARLSARLWVLGAHTLHVPGRQGLRWSTGGRSRGEGRLPTASPALPQPRLATITHAPPGSLPGRGWRMNSAFRCAFCFRPGFLSDPPAAPAPGLPSAPARGPGAPALSPDFSALLSPHEGTAASHNAPALNLGQSGDPGVWGPGWSRGGRTGGTCRNVGVLGQHYPHLRPQPARTL